MPTSKRIRAISGWGAVFLTLLFVISAAAVPTNPPAAGGVGGAAPAALPGAGPGPIPGAGAGTAATAPAVGRSEKLEITITGIDGIVQFRTADDQPWRIPKVGMKLDQGAEFRTGPRSAVRFVIPPDQTVTLDRLGTVKVLQAVRDANKVKTDLGMKYGRTRYDIEAAGIEHQSNILGPGSTLAVRGTKVSLYDQPPFEPEVRSLTGRALYITARQAKVPFGAKGRQAAVTGEQASAAHHEVDKTHLNPISLADSDDQQRLFFIDQRIIAERLSQIFSDTTDFYVTQSQMHPYNTSDPLSVEVNASQSLRPAATIGSLVFDLTWTNASNVNLIVTSPVRDALGGIEILAATPNLQYAQEAIPLNGSLPQVTSGGKIDPGPFDMLQANPQLAATPQTGGRETAYWPVATPGNPNPYPTGSYTVKANLTAGSEPFDPNNPKDFINTTTDVTLSIYQNGVLVKPPITREITGSRPTVTFPRITITTPKSH